MRRESGAGPDDVIGADAGRRPGAEPVGIEGERQKQKSEIMRRLYESNKKYTQTLGRLMMYSQGNRDIEYGAARLLDQLRALEQIALDASGIQLDDYASFFDEIVEVEK